jgi:UDP-glucose 4-epimerase
MHGYYKGDSMMKTILVTGGAGFIGSHTCIKLQESGYDVLVLDNFSNSKPDVLLKIQEVSGIKLRLAAVDMNDEEEVERVFRENDIDAVIHFAGYKAVGESVAKPLEYYANNVMGTLTILKAMKKYDVRRMVFSSSATVYGMNQPVPYREDMITTATNPYGSTKIMIEKILTDICAADPNFSAVLLRYFNPIGAHPSGRIGENPVGIPNNLVPYIARVAVGQLPELSIYGGDYPTPDGTGVRDYIHVMDLAEGHLAALEYAAEHTGAEAINLGTGRGSSVLQVVESYEKAVAHKIPYRIVDRRSGDMAFCYADTRKAKELLNWSAQKTLDEMCADSWQFTRQNLLDPNGT